MGQTVRRAYQSVDDADIHRLGKVARWDALFYVAAQFIGGALGASAAALVLAPWAAHPSVNYVVTEPGSSGNLIAFAGEVIISFILMTVILQVSNIHKLHKLTGLCAGALVAIYITIETPISGMSMNPARTFASALAGNSWTALWIYFTAPLIGMLAAAEVYLRSKDKKVGCAKVHHANSKRCIFCGKPAS